MIQVRNLSKSFGNFQAVKNLNFDVASKEIFGFIGPNGAGKTTTIKMLTTLLEPDTGTAWIDGYCVRRYPDRVRRIIGYMPDYYGVYEGVTIEEYLDFFAAAYRLTSHKKKQRVADCMALTDLMAVKDKQVSTLSKGMKQRLCLAKTLLHDPKVLILDEPAAGLDPRARVELRALLRELKSLGKTILISSHILTELSDMVSSVIIIESGEMVVSGTPDTISETLSPHLVIQISVHGESHFAPAERILTEHSLVQKVTIEESKLFVEYHGEKDQMYLLLKSLVEQDIPVTGFTSSRQNLEDIFMQVTKGIIS